MAARPVIDPDEDQVQIAFAPRQRRKWTKTARRCRRRASRRLGRG